VYTFDATNSSDSDGSIKKYAWDFGDGSGSQSSMATHSYSARGAYNVSLVVIDNAGESKIATRPVYVSDASVAPATTSTQRRPANAGSDGGLSAETLKVLAAVAAFALIVFALFRFGKKQTVTEDWREFEFEVAGRFRKDRWSVDVTPGQKDGGYDIELWKDGRMAIAECKRWGAGSNVGVPSVRALYGVMKSEHASKAFFITTSDFTCAARDFASDKKDLVLVDGGRLDRWMSARRMLEDV